MPSLQCLISALTQVGGGDLLFRFPSSVQSCYGEGGVLQTDIAVCGEHSPCSGHTGFAPHRAVCAFPVYTAQAPGCSIWSGPCVECGSSFQVLHKRVDSVAPAFCVFPGLSGSGSQGLERPLPGRGTPFPSAARCLGSQRLGRPLPGHGAPFPSMASGPGSQRLGALSPGAVRLFPPRPQRAPPVGSQEVFRQEPGPVCRVGGGGFSGAESAPFPSPCRLPPAGMGRLFSGVSQPLCFANRRWCVPAG